jgi:hypothetical protein
MPDVTFLVPKGVSPRVSVGGDARPLPSDLEARQCEALRDPPTRLPLSALLIDRVAVAIARAQRANRCVAVLVLSNIRCTPSRAVDLRSIAQTLQQRLRADDTVAQVGDSALVVVCDAIETDEEARRIARRLMESTGIVCRIGITLSGAQVDPEQVVARVLKHMAPMLRRATDAPDVA